MFSFLYTTRDTSLLTLSLIRQIIRRCQNKIDVISATFLPANFNVADFISKVWTMTSTWLKLSTEILSLIPWNLAVSLGVRKAGVNLSATYVLRSVLRIRVMLMRTRIQELNKIRYGSGSRPNFDTYPDSGKNETDPDPGQKNHLN